MKNKVTVDVFSSFKDENMAESHRRAQMTMEQRCAEFAALQERQWGTDWSFKPMEKVLSCEKLYD